MSQASEPRRVGPYVVERELGRGGMGVVWLARDEALGRRVAIKSLAGAAGADRTRMERLEREARLLASLNHPHIGAIHAIERDAHGSPCLVLEYVEGLTLADALLSGPMRISAALRLASEVADALSAAHARGIVHRDLKPSNIMVTPSGAAKVLDFGVGRDAGDESPDREPTTAVTAEGTLVGTPGYMSPEQLRGEEVDQRADLFALGCVAYECFAGAPAFGGKTPHERVRATLQGRVDWSLVPKDVAPAVVSMLQRCLAAHAGLRAADSGEARDVFAAAAGGEGATGAGGNLPREATSFIGREDDLRRVRHLLGNSALVTLVGPGGCGKTRLAVHVAREMAGEIPDGVWMVDLSGVSEASHVGVAAAKAIGAREREGVTPVEAVAAFLRESRAMLLLDNCEHVPDAAAELAAAIVSGARGVRVLATSQSPLGIGGEAVCRIGPMTLPGTAPNAAEVGKSEAARLFAERGASAMQGFALTDANAAAVASICRRLDGLPLAIELAAARLNVLTPAQIDARLDDRFRLLTGGRAGMDRHRTLRALVEWSYALLNDQEQAILRGLSVFGGGCTLGAAAAVCGAEADELSVIDALSRLAERSLIVFDASAARYRMLQSVREFCREQLELGGEAGVVKSRHAAHYATVADGAEGGLSGPGQEAAAAGLDPEQDNLRAALRWSLDARGAPGAPDALHLAAALSKYWYLRGQFREGRLWIESALASAGQGHADEPLASNAAGILCWSVGDRAAAKQWFSRSLKLWESRGEGRRVAAALSNLGVIADEEGDRAEGRRMHSRAIEAYRKLGDAKGEAQASLNLGALAAREGDHAEASRLFHASLAVFRAEHDAQRLAKTLRNLGELACREGRLREAFDCLEESLRISSERNDPRDATAILELLSLVSVRAGQFEQAARLVGAAEASRHGREMPAHGSDAEILSCVNKELQGSLSSAGHFVDEGRRWTDIRAVLARIARPTAP